MAKKTEEKPLLNPNSPLTTGLKAALLTGSAASVVALARQIGEAKRQRDKEKERQKRQVSGNAIVFHLRKNSEDGSCGKSCNGGAPVVKKVESLVQKEVNPATADTQLRETNGRFTDINSKTAGYIDNTVNGSNHILAAIGGGAAGFYLVSKIAQKAEQNRLKKQIAAAQQEYLDLLEGRSVKNAEAFKTLFSLDGDTDAAIGEIEKQAGIFKDTKDIINGGSRGAQQLSSAALAAYILLAGGSAWATKKLLEKRFDPPEEEEPEEAPRIILKAGSAEFDIQPEHMMATIGIMRDCISDSMSDLEKKAADYEFLGDIAKDDEGKQFLLDLYAKKNGLKRDPFGEGGYKLPIGIAMKYSNSLSDVANNPDKHSDAINAHVMKMMKGDPESWFRVLGSNRNTDVVDLKAREAIGNMDKGTGFKSWLSRVPVIGNLFKKFMGWYSTNSRYGRKAVARQSLAGMGVTGDKADSILDRFDFSSKGWSPKQVQAPAAQPSQATAQSAVMASPFLPKTASEKKADMLNDVIAMTAQTKTLSDRSNKDILKALEELKKQNGGDKDKKADQYVEFSPEVEAMLSPEAKKKLMIAFSK